MGFKKMEDKELIPGRVFEEHRGLYKVMTDGGDYHNAVITGKMYFETEEETQLPSVGDYVGIELSGSGGAVLRKIMPRKSAFVRKAAGPVSRAQTLAVNFDYVFIVASMNSDFNIGRLDRYVSMAWDSGGIPVIILSKADLSKDRDGITGEITENYPGVDCLLTSTVTGEGIDDLKKYFTEGQTAVLLGSSGVGKSSLLNCLCGFVAMDVRELRSNLEKGRHTTTHRQMVGLPSGGFIIDTPGMRELGIWHSDDGIERGFGDISGRVAELSHRCRFSDCRHDEEPGCAVKEAIGTGEISEEQFERYRKLVREAGYMERRINEKARIDERRNRKSLAKKIRNRNKVTW